MRFRKKHGFERNRVNLGNWREKPYSTWSFQHVHEIITSSLVLADHHHRVTLDKLPDDLNTAAVTFQNETIALENFLRQSYTDIFLVSRKGQRVFDWHAESANPRLPHIVFSVSKSISGLLAGILQDQKVLDTSRTVAFYLQEMKNSAYADCPLQHLLDMRVSLDFVEEYLNLDGDYARYRRATGWNPALTGSEDPGLREFLQGLQKGETDHGGKFEYRSPNSDLLGLIVERVSDQPFAELMSEFLWSPLKADHDAFITVDKYGAPRSAGGISVVANDLLKIGELICQNGEIDGKTVVSESWLNDLQTNGDPKAWDAGDFAKFIPGASYRNQWYLASPPERVALAIGIHGQWIYCDIDKNVVLIKLSSQPIPQDDVLDVECLSVFRQVAKELA